MRPKRQAPVSHYDDAYRGMQAIVRNEDGVAAIEYALLASLMAIVAVAGIVTLGSRVEEMWAWISMQVSGAV